MPHLRYGHSEGHTDVCYTDDSRFIITCGSEGDVRVWNGIDDTDQKDVCVGEQAWAVCHKAANLYVATDTSIVQAYTFPDLEVDGIITRFKAPVTQIDISPDGKKLAAGSNDMEIHIVDMDSMERKIITGHKAPVLSVSIDPHLKYLASASCDGTVRVWDLKTSDCVKQWDCVEKSNSFETANSVHRIHFQPDGRYLAVPVSRSIKLYERDSWTLMQSFSIDSNNHCFSVTRFSKSGNLLAGGTVEGSVFVWDILQEKIIAQHLCEKNSAITSIAWNPSSQDLVFCNSLGQLGDLRIRSDLSVNTDALVEPDGSIPLGVPEYDDDEEDGETIISLEKIKAESGFIEGKFQETVEEEKEDRSESSDDEGASRDGTRVPLTELQAVFQPSSTPSHLIHRFMVWNNVGIVRLFNNEDTDEIDVEFHDTNLHHGFRLNNSLGYSLATLTKQALILACPRKLDSPSRLYCVLLKAWDSQKEWDVSLGNEEAVAVSGGDNWICVATDRRMLRIFSVDGTQTDIFSIPGPLISLAGYLNQLNIFFHSAQGSDREQFVSWMQVTVSPDTKISHRGALQALPLSPKSTLRWVGFSDEGSSAFLDSEGMLRVLYDKLWRPISSLEDRSKGKFDHYFILGISERCHNIRCILCKGAYYPPVIPKPLVTEIEWQVPLCELDNEKGRLEEEMLRSVITVPNLQLTGDYDYEDAKKSIEKSISVTVMKLFALACRSGLEGRAVSLCESMPSVDVVKLASKYAAKLGRHQLANRISEVAVKMSQPKNLSVQDVEVEEEKEEAEVEHTTIHRIENGSQDLFSDSESSQKNSIKEKENLILKMRKKKAESNIVIKPFKRHTVNPFKKASQVDEYSIDKNILEPKINYMDWFNQNHSQLKEEFPLLKDDELIILAMKKYRQQVHNQVKSDAPEVIEAVQETNLTSSENDVNTTSESIKETKKKEISR